jgi:hypothetical protein
MAKEKNTPLKAGLLNGYWEIYYDRTGDFKEYFDDMGEGSICRARLFIQENQLTYKVKKDSGKGFISISDDTQISIQLVSLEKIGGIPGTVSLKTGLNLNLSKTHPNIAVGVYMYVDLKNTIKTGRCVMAFISESKKDFEQNNFVYTREIQKGTTHPLEKDLLNFFKKGPNTLGLGKGVFLAPHL